jgi:hypothetical protein
MIGLEQGDGIGRLLGRHGGGSLLGG